MATITLGAAANWSTCNGGGPPAGTDHVYLNGYAFTLDAGSGAGGNEFTCASIKARASDGTTPTGGTIVLPLATTIINADITAGTATLITISSGANKTLVVNGTAQGGTASNIRAVTCSDSGTILTITTVIGGTGSTAHGLACTNVNTLSVTNAYGGTNNGVGLFISGGTTFNEITYVEGGTGAHGCTINVASKTFSIVTAQGGSGATLGLNLTAESTVTIGTAIGGLTAGAAGVYMTRGTVTIDSVKGGSVAGAGGVQPNGGTCNVVETDLTGTGYPIAVGTGTLKISDGAVLQYQDAAGNAKKFYGDSEMPAVADVEDGVVYGDGDFEGTLVAGGGGGTPLGFVMIQ